LTVVVDLAFFGFGVVVVGFLHGLDDLAGLAKGALSLIKVVVVVSVVVGGVVRRGRGLTHGIGGLDASAGLATGALSLIKDVVIASVVVGGGVVRRMRGLSHGIGGWVVSSSSDASAGLAKLSLSLIKDVVIASVVVGGGVVGCVRGLLHGIGGAGASGVVDATVLNGTSDVDIDSVGALIFLATVGDPSAVTALLSFGLRGHGF